jgi:hypothetical protein
MRRRYRDDGETHHTVGAKILEACGRGLLIASASLVLGAVLGTSNLASVGLWTLAAAASIGIGLHIGAAIVHNAGCDRDDGEAAEPRQAAEVLSLAAALPVELEAVHPAEQRPGYAEQITRDRDQQHGHGR